MLKNAPITIGNNNVYVYINNKKSLLEYLQTLTRKVRENFAYEQDNMVGFFL